MNIEVIEESCECISVKVNEVPVSQFTRKYEAIALKRQLKMLPIEMVSELLTKYGVVM